MHHVAGIGVLVLADKLLLRITDAEPLVTLGLQSSRDATAPAATAVTATPTGSIYIALSRLTATYGRPHQARTAHTRLIGRRRGRWQTLDLPQVPEDPNGWVIGKLAATSHGLLYAALYHVGLWADDVASTRLSPLPWLTRLYEYDGRRWRDISGPGHL